MRVGLLIFKHYILHMLGAIVDFIREFENKLRTEGVVYRYEVLQMLKIPRTSDGQIIFKVWDPTDYTQDNCSD